MLKDERDLLDALKFERYFLAHGGYEGSRTASWRPMFIFEDSPTCMNFKAKENRRPCSECVLMHLVPFQRRFAKIPCRYIPLHEAGETLTSLYQYSDQNQIEETLGSWLQAAIHRLEEQRRVPQQDDTKKPTQRLGSVIGTPLYRNPACPTAFHWTGGGKFFRFRTNPASATGDSEATYTPTGVQEGLRHYWLCEKCCHVFSLAHDDAKGVVVKSLWTELPAAEAHNEVADTKSHRSLNLRPLPFVPVDVPAVI